MSGVRDSYVDESWFPGKYWLQCVERGREAGRAEGREAGREEGLRRAIVALVSARLPELEGELEQRLRGQPEARLVEIVTELGKVSDAGGVRAVLDRSV